MIRATIAGGGAKGLAADLMKDLRRRAVPAVKDSLLLLEGAAKELLSRPGTGRIYELGERDVSFVSRSSSLGGAVFSRKGRNVRAVSFTANRGKASRVHQASAPGEPPAVDTGRLRSSVSHEGPYVDGNRVHGRWGTNVEYADDLEFGTSRIAPRPWARRAEEETRDAVDARLRQV